MLCPPLKVCQVQSTCPLNLLDPPEFAMLLAAAGHDVGHPGVNNVCGGFATFSIFARCLWLYDFRPSLSIHSPPYVGDGLLASQCSSCISDHPASVFNAKSVLENLHSSLVTRVIDAAGVTSSMDPSDIVDVRWVDYPLLEGFFDVVVPRNDRGGYFGYGHATSRDSCRPVLVAAFGHWWVSVVRHCRFFQSLSRNPPKKLPQ